jgi:CubicO group peptidase (beta-lactamase class C family)
MRALLGLALALSTAVTLAQANPSHESKVDAVFARWTSSTPGCAVGVSQGGKPVLQKAYGMADLEHDVPNRPDTIFEAGSVSKQFTAAAILLLAQDGKLSLDDPARKYVPELPDYGTPLTIRHMLQHTSGLRDWGEIGSIAGWPRTSRAYTHSHVLDIVRRQKSLNFTPGAQYSYSNSGYNLAAIIVSRVSGKSFADFSRERIFEPLGMTRTSWRDDFTRIVKDRAMAYTTAGDGFRTQMPFENVHGNGGLLTTVGDLLKWNENFVDQKVGDAAFLKVQQEPGRLNDGSAHQYAMGLTVRDYKGLPEVGHSGSTAGNRAQPTRTPFTADPKEFTAYAGRYYSDEAEVTYDVAIESDALVIKRRPDVVMRLRPTGKDEFSGAGGGTIRFIRGASGRVEELSYRGSRVFDLRFKRQASGTD